MKLDTLQLKEEEFDHIFLVLDLGENDMKQLLESIPYTSMDEDHIVTILYNMLCATNFIHSANVIHRDLKPSNMLINSDCNVKICDFGLARCMPKLSIAKKSLE